MNIDTLNTCAGRIAEPRHRHRVLVPGTAEPGQARPGSAHPDQLGAIPPGLVQLQPILVTLGLAKPILVPPGLAKLIYYCRSSWRISLIIGLPLFGAKKTKSKEDLRRRK